MPAPTPYLLTSIASFDFAMDAIRKDDPSTPGQAPMDEQRYERFPLSPQSFEEDVQMDSKLLWLAKLPPWRIVSMGDTFWNGGGAWTAQQLWSEFNSSPKYWNSIPWGNLAAFLNTSGGGGFDSGYIAFDGGFELLAGSTSTGLGSGGEYLAAWLTWSQVADGFHAAAYGRALRAFQVICPSFQAPKNYDIWQVTGRWQVRLNANIATWADDGYGDHFPIPVPPWVLSTDFQKVSSGVLNPGQILTVGPSEFDPVNGGCQSPPAPSNRSPGTNWGVGGYSDWDGWAVGTYIVFTS